MNNENSLIPHDSDFDEPNTAPDSPLSKKALEMLPPKILFGAGVITAVLVLGTIGFFILLALLLKGGTARAIPSSDPAIGAAPRAPSPQLPSDAGGAIAVRAVDNTDHIRGKKDAPITLVEYSDTECPFCKRFHPTMQRLIEEYDGKVRWVYRHFPLRSLHQKAAKEAEATECAGEQGKFWEYLDKLFEVTPSNDGLDTAQLPVLAEQVGISRQKFEICLNSGTYAQHVSDDEKDATGAGARGTPYTVVLTKDGQKIPVSGAVPFEQLKSIIDSL